MPKKKTPTNLAASVHDRLLTIARERREELQSVLTRYAVERLLFRLGKSTFREKIVLKGAVLFSLWNGSPHRPTRDVDFLAYGDASADEVSAIVRDLCAVDVEADGLDFLADSVKPEPIRDRQVHSGVRLTLLAMLGTARVPLQIDVGFGDAVTPPPTMSTFPTLLDFPAPHVRTYPPESVVAEKLEAMVSLRSANTRMKDFYDVWFLAGTRAFDGSTLSRAIGATFSRRGTRVPATTPTAFTKAFTRDREKQAQWTAFLSRARLADAPPDLVDVMNRVASFVLPAMGAVGRGDSFSSEWTPEAGWRR